MLPNIKVQNLISKHAELEKKLSSGEIDKKIWSRGSGGNKSFCYGYRELVVKLTGIQVVIFGIMKHYQILKLIVLQKR